MHGKMIQDYMRTMAGFARRLVRRKQQSEGELAREKPAFQAAEDEEQPAWKIGNCVVVREGVQDVDAGGSLEGYQGRIDDIDTDEENRVLLGIRWDSVTLKSIPLFSLEQMEVEGLDWSIYYLFEEEVELAAERDTQAQVRMAVQKISRQLAWVGLGEVGERIRQVLEGVNLSDEKAVLEAWERNLRKTLSFPFKARVSEFQEKGDLQAGDRLSVQEIDHLDDLYGVIVEVRQGRDFFNFPLCDLVVVVTVKTDVGIEGHGFAQKGLKEAGFSGYKLHPKAGYDGDLVQCRAVREAVGADMLLMSDPVAAYNHQQALRMARELEKLNYYWFEEPLMDPDIEGYVELTRRLEIPVVGTEWGQGSVWGVYTAPQYLVRRAVDIIRSDVSWKGGITGLLKTFHLCEAFGFNCEVHTTMMSLMDHANLHVICSRKNCEWFEYAGPLTEGIGFGIQQPIRLDADGYVAPTSAPGLGVDLDWDQIDPQIVTEL